MFKLPLFVLLRRIAEPISFLSPFFPPISEGICGIYVEAVEFSCFCFHRKNNRFQLPPTLPHPWLSAGMWKRLFFKRFRFHTYRFRFRFHQQKTKKRPLTIFFNFCGSLACLLLHFIILRKQKPSFIAITLPTSLELIVSNYSVFLFLRYQNSC